MPTLLQHPDTIAAAEVRLRRTCADSSQRQLKVLDTINLALAGHGLRVRIFVRPDGDEMVVQAEVVPAYATD